MFESLKRIFSPAPQKTGKRAYQAGKINRLNGNWGLTGTNSSIDYETRFTLKIMRQRSRDLYENNDYARRFIRMCESNIVGADGVHLHVKGEDAPGKLDVQGNQKVEVAYKKWGKRGQCDVTRKFSLPALERLLIGSVARDGEVFVRIVKGYDNDFGFALQVLEADYVNEDYNGTYGDNEIRMGVELDKWGCPVAYHIHNAHPGDYTYYRGDTHYKRIPAEEIIHLFVAERPGQTRGIPWMVTSMERIKNLSAYEEAEITAARVAASKMGFIITPDGESYNGDDEDDRGNIITEVEPGIIEQLPIGTDFKSFDVGSPNTNYEPFAKRTLRGIAAGLNVSYNSLAGDLESVNYSSLRAGALEERDMWMTLQDWFIQAFSERVYAEWLSMAILTNQIQLPANKKDKFAVCKFQARRWMWVDPSKDISSTIDAIGAGLKSRTEACSEAGKDFNQIVAELAAEEKALKAAGVTIATQTKPVGAVDVNQNP